MGNNITKYTSVKRYTATAIPRTTDSMGKFITYVYTNSSNSYTIGNKQSDGYWYTSLGLE